MLSSELHGWGWRICVGLAFAVLLCAPGSALSTASNTTVTANVVSAVSLTNNCTNSAAYNFGTVAPGSLNTTATGASVCSLSFSSSNDTSMLRIGQADGTGAAMGQPTNASQAISTDNSDFTFGVAAFSSTLAWSVTYAGNARRTTDGGATWTEYVVTGASKLTAVAADRNDGTGNTWYAVGINGAVYKSTNGAGGAPTWALATAQPSSAGWPAGSDAYAVAVFKDAGLVTNVILTGDNGWTARSTNGGTAWTASQIGVVSLRGVSGIDGTNNVYAVGCTQLVTSTTSGASFVVGTTVGEGCMSKVAAGDATHVYAAGNSGIHFYNGAAWSTPAGTANDYYGDVAVIPGTPTTAVAVGQDGDVELTTNGGTTWIRKDSKTGNTLAGVTMPTASRIIAVGTEKVSTMSADGGTTFAQTFQVAGKTDYPGIAASPENGQLLMEVGSTDAVQRSTDGGQTWTPGTAPAGTALFAVDLASSTTGWAVGENGMIAVTGDGGATWTQQAAGLTSARLRAVVAVDNLRAFAAGDGGVVLKTIDGGTTWTALASGTAQDLYGIWSTDGTTVVTDGNAGAIRCSTDGGATFATPTNPGGTPSLKQMDGSGSTIYIAGSFNLVWKSTDSGATFTAPALTVNKDYDYVSVVSPDVAWFGTQSSALVETTDGGLTWTSPTAPGLSLSSYHSLAAVDTHTAYVAGDDYFFTRWLPSGSAAAIVSDYGAGATWGSAASTNMFGVCLQAINGSTSASAPWVVDTFGTAGLCQTNDTDPWNAIPATMTKVAYTSTAGASGRSDFTFGFRPSSSQVPGLYSAAVVFEALAPSV